MLARQIVIGWIPNQQGVWRPIFGCIPRRGARICSVSAVSRHSEDRRSLAGEPYARVAVVLQPAGPWKSGVQRLGHQPHAQPARPLRVLGRRRRTDTAPSDLGARRSRRSKVTLRAGQQPPSRYEISLLDLSRRSGVEAEGEVTNSAAQAAKCLCDLQQGSLLRTLLVRLAKGCHRLDLAMHHLIFGVGSLSRVVLPESIAVYKTHSTGLPSPLLNPPTRYEHSVPWQRTAETRAGLHSLTGLLAGSARRDARVLSTPRPPWSTFSASGAGCNPVVPQRIWLIAGPRGVVYHVHSTWGGCLSGTPSALLRPGGRRLANSYGSAAMTVLRVDRGLLPDLRVYPN